MLISLLIISLLLLGFDATQLTALRAAKSAYYLGVADQQLMMMAEQLRARVQYVDDVEQLVSTWNQQNQRVLPQGYGQVTRHFPFFELILVWGKMTVDHCTNSKIGASGCLRQKVMI